MLLGINMECTQRLENTQDFFDIKSERVFPDQIGFLGICGEKYPIKKGPNKIGRDPTTCSIVLNLNEFTRGRTLYQGCLLGYLRLTYFCCEAAEQELLCSCVKRVKIQQCKYWSISRQHAVINILNHKEFMVMDLDSANKTKLMDKTLQPYIPQSLSNGDMVQFGDVFGVFRLLEEDTDLPMTQAIDIPDTPVSTRYVSKVNKIPVTTIPESPDVSDKDDSFIAPSQPNRESCHGRSNINFVKPSSKVISIQPIGSKKIDNIYWSSTKKSISFNLSQHNESKNDINDSIAAEKVVAEAMNDINDIHEMETQHFVLPKSNDDSIYNMETQPFVNNSMAVKTKSATLDTNTFMNDKPCNITKNTSIYDMETQPPIVIDTCLKYTKTCQETNVHDMETQDLSNFPNLTDNKNTPGNKNRQEKPVKEKSCEIKSIYDMETQPAIISDNCLQYNKNVHEIDTQIIKHPNDPDINENKNESVTCTNLTSELSSNKENKPEVCKIVKQHEVQINLFTHNKENENIFTAETQPFFIENDKTNIKEISINNTDVCKNLNVSDEEILFDEPEIQNIDDDVFSQPLMIPEVDISERDNSLETNSQNDSLKDKVKRIESETLSNGISIHSDSSTDCEDIDMLPTQKIENFQGDDDDLTDCEDLIELKPIRSSKKPGSTERFEEMSTQVIDEIRITSNQNSTDKPPQSSTESLNDNYGKHDISDLPTQITGLPEEKSTENNCVEDNNFHDLQTQVIEDDTEYKSLNLQKKGKKFASPFKIPVMSPVKSKKIKETANTESRESFMAQKTTTISNENDDIVNYYESTQDIVDDLCSQKDWPSKSVTKPVIQHEKCIKLDNSDFGPGSEKNFEICNSKSSPKNYVLDKSFESSDGDEKVNKFIANLSSQQIRNVIGVETPVDIIKKTSSSDLSDIEMTPKKVRPKMVMDIDLPDSQEIKTNVSRHRRPVVTESSSESEPENDSEEQCTPILFRKNNKSKKDTKFDLTKKFDVDTLPTRVITRVRKPTLKFQSTNDEIKKTPKNILKPKFLSEQEEDIDKDIINENISRLKNKSKDKVKNVTSKKESKQTNMENSDINLKENKVNPLEINLTHGVVLISDNGKTEKKVNEQINESNNHSNSKKPAKRGSKRKDVPKKDIKVSADNEIEECLKTETLENVKETKIPTRVTRNRRNVKNEETSTKIDKSISKKDKTNSKNNDSSEMHVIDLTVDSALDVRRSNRVRSSRNKKEDKAAEATEDTSKMSTTKPGKHEQSAVYNMSSESVPDLPKSLKRSATVDLDHPKPKRTRSLVNNKSRTPTPARVMQTQHVLFTAFPSEEVRAKLEKLGAVIVSDVADSTVVLTMQIKRTFKLLCAVGLGRPIVGPSWVQACVDHNFIVDPWLHILKDEAAEKRFQFNLERVLMGKRNFLEGFNVSSTPNVMPTTSEMKLIVECSGGTWSEGGAKWVCVSCVKDRAMWSALKRRGASLVSTEFILGGVLRQRADLAANKL